MWDAMVESTGRIDVPQTVDLIYQFLPVRWATIRHDGVELSNMVYDSPLLDPYRYVPQGFFRHPDRAAPFYVDPHDLSRIWFRDPETCRVGPIPWRGANRTEAPMTKAIVDAACRRIRERGGNTVLKSGGANQQILDELGELTTSPIEPRMRRPLNAATRRVEQSRIDHDEAQSASGSKSSVPQRITSLDDDHAGFRREWPNLLEGD
jgi:hypothetical protein